MPANPQDVQKRNWDGPTFAVQRQNRLSGIADLKCFGRRARVDRLPLCNPEAEKNAARHTTKRMHQLKITKGWECCLWACVAETRKDRHSRRRRFFGSCMAISHEREHHFNREERQNACT
jgi:hypothetical protein